MKPISADNVKFAPVKTPDIGLPEELPALPDAIFPARLARLRAAMDKSGFDKIVIYADREHYANFRYFVGFEPRFEEGLLVVGKNDPSFLFLGNECIPMHPHARIPVEAALCQVLSLPNQPMDKSKPLEAFMKDAGIAPGLKVGLAGWKLFQPANGAAYKSMFCAPGFIVDALRAVAGADNVVNATGLMTDPADGLRIVNEPEQIAVYEFGSSLAGQGVLNLWNAVEPGVSEFELADRLVGHGLQLSCHPIVAMGFNVSRGLVSPTSYRGKAKDPITASFGLEGGLSCRGGYLVDNENALDGDLKRYFDAWSKPYYAAVASWYEKVGVGVAGGEMYDLVQSILPKEKYGWVLNPGHLIGNEEWLSSPVYPGSQIKLKSGMLMQMDIIPSGGCVSPNVEDGVLLADASLRKALETGFPGVWARMQKRRDYMKQSLGIELGEDVLPMSNYAGLYRPMALNKELGLVIER